VATIRWIVDRSGGLFLLSHFLTHVKVQAFLQRGLWEQEAFLLHNFTIHLSHPGDGDLMLCGNLRKGQVAEQDVLLDIQKQVGDLALSFPPEHHR